MAKAPEGSRGGRRLSEEEARLWRRAVGDAMPLEPGDPPPPQPQPPPVSPHPSPPPRQIRPLAPRPPLEIGETAGMDKRKAIRFRRGQLPIEGRVDLHGYTRAQAHGALQDFIIASAEAGRRCVLVITGKGFRPDGIGVIRAAVPQWLNQPPLQEHILAFNSARPRDGGEGAYYVLLRRRR